MGILVNKTTKVIVQGFTGKEGTFHSSQCMAYGTNIVGGVTPGKGGMTHLNRPVFNTVQEAVQETGAETSLLFVPPQFAADAMIEAAEAGIKLLVCITEGIPIKDTILAKRKIIRHDAMLIGPNCPGIITTGETKIGIMPGSVFQKGPVGLISRSGTLTYEAANQIVNNGLGISTAIGIGGDPVIGATFVDLLELFEKDPETRAVVMVGEIGGDLEIRAAEYVKQGHVTKPVVAFIAGRTAPKGKRMGHAGAIISGPGNRETAEGKMAAFRDAGVTVVETPADIGKSVLKSFRRHGTE